MLNRNGHIVDEESLTISNYNRAFNYGDAVFETIKVVNKNILFWEDHYFRLMASMRILRMEIPMNFTMGFLEEEIFKLLDKTHNKTEAKRVKLFIYRTGKGLYLPSINGVEYLISCNPLEQMQYRFISKTYHIDLYKDHYISPSLLSTLKTNNRSLNVIASIFAKENDYDNCLLLNTNKHIVEAINSNLFLVKGKGIKTPPLSDGCINGILRKQIIKLVQDVNDFNFIEDSVSSFELQQADELFLTNTIIGIQPISKFRKKIYGNVVSSLLIKKLNKMISIN